MGTGQSLFTLIAMMLLTMITTRVNSTLLQTQEVSQNSKYSLVAISLATSKIQRATALAFDENSIDNPVTATSSLSSTLGKESGENTEDSFTDIDDYNGFYQRDSSLRSALFDIRCTVAYVNASTPDITTTTRTWNKRITVQVTSAFMKDTVRLSTIHSYWRFR